MIVIVNAAAAGGTAPGTWRRIAPVLEARLGRRLPVVVEEPDALEAAVHGAMALGHRTIVAAGGDGTVNTVATAILDCPDRLARAATTLGAIGLGSSNDFHKPARHEIDGVPYRLDERHAERHDVGTLIYEDEAGSSHVRFWLLNASVGLTAAANLRFNRPTRFLAFLKRMSSAWAITWTAIATLLRPPSGTFDLTLDGRDLRAARVRNLGVVKNPHFGGSLRYDSPHEPASGRFHVHLLSGISVPRLWAAAVALARGRFAGRPGTATVESRRIAIRNGGPFPIEFDGEVVEAIRAELALFPRGLRICT